MEKELGTTQVYWGNGKGKTTASLGLALRALGNGFKVCLIQFMKCGIETENLSEYGELVSLKKFENFCAKSFGAKEWVTKNPSKVHLAEGKKAIEFSKKILSGKKYGLVILDEILYAVQFGLVSEQEVIDLIESKNKSTELVLTGSHIPFQRIFEKTDLVTEMKKHKHYFDKGLKARAGVEF